VYFKLPAREAPDDADQAGMCVGSSERRGGVLPRW